jgi:hypothetical protein
MLHLVRLVMALGVLASLHTTSAADDENGVVAPLLADSFEAAGRRPNQPAGWHYLRHGRVEADAGVPDGDRKLSFDCESPGRDAEARRTIAVDGRQIRRLNASLWVRAATVQPGQFAEQRLSFDGLLLLPLDANPSVFTVPGKAAAP